MHLIYPGNLCFYVKLYTTYVVWTLPLNEEYRKLHECILFIYFTVIYTSSVYFKQTTIAFAVTSVHGVTGDSLFADKNNCGPAASHRTNYIYLTHHKPFTARQTGSRITPNMPKYTHTESTIKIPDICMVVWCTNTGNYK